MSLISLNLNTLPIKKEKRGNPLEIPGMLGNIGAIESWLGGDGDTASGERIDETTALQIMEVYSCVRLIAQTVGSLPLKLYERLSQGRQEAVDNYLYDLLTVSPNTEMNAVVFWESAVGCLALTGNSYVYIQRVGPQVASLWPLDPRLTKPVRIADGTPTGRLVYECREGMQGNEVRTYDAKDILHFKLFSLDGVIGLSPIRMAREGLGLTRAAEKMGARLFKNNGRPSGIMSSVSNLNEQQMLNVRESWQASQSGNNALKTAFLNGGEWKYTPISLDMEDIEFLKTRAFQRSSIAALFGVPAHLIGDTTRQSNTNSEQEALTLVQFTLKPYLSKIENELQRTLLPSVGRNANKYFVQFDVRDLLRADIKTHNQSLTLARQGGWMSVNEIREELGQNPIGPIGDTYIVPLNYRNAKDLLLDPEPMGEQEGVEPIQQTKQIAAPTEDTPPTDDERSLVQRASGLTILFRDAMGRLLNRETRSLDAITGIFEPCLRTIMTFSIDDANKKLGSSWADQKAQDRIVTDALKGIDKRCAVYKLEDVEGITADEFKKALRAIVANVYREVAASSVQ